MVKRLSFDTETSGLDLHLSDRMFAFASCDEQERSSVFRYDVDPLKATRRLRELFQDASNGKAILSMHNAKFDLTAVSKEPGMYDLTYSAAFEDTMIMSRILRNDGSHGLKELAYRLAGYPRDDEAAVKRCIGASSDYSRVPHYIMEKYQIADVERTQLLRMFFEPRINESAAFRAAYRVEKDLINVTRRMEERGIQLNRAETKRMIQWCCHERDAARARLPINPESSKQTVDFLFRKLKLPEKAVSKKTGIPSTAKGVILELLTEFPDLEPLRDIMRYRSYEGGATTLSSYLEFADEDDIIHPSLNTCEANTHRQSCSRPNLQNTQKSESLLSPYPVPARRCFGPRKGFINIHIDYAGIEIRLIVDASGDVEMIFIIRNGGDPHTEAASIFYGAEWSAADAHRRKILRSAAKNGHFLIAYAGGLAKLSRTLGVPINILKGRLAQYAAKFPGIINLNRTIAGEAKANGGYIENRFGRRLYLESGKLYTGVNYRIQSDAACILKIAEIRVAEYLREATNDEARILIPIHDEIIIEYPRARMSELNRHLRAIRARMLDFPEFAVPLDVEFSLSTARWDRKKEYILPPSAGKRKAVIYG